MRQSSIEKASLQEFSGYYLASLKMNLQGFGEFFNVIRIFFWTQVFISVIITIILIPRLGLFAAFQLISLSLNLAIVVWFSSLAKDFVMLQRQKVENDIFNTIQYRAETKTMSEEILKRAQRKAENRITVTGGNAVFALDGSSVTGVSQKNVQGSEKLVESLALLVTYCEEADDQYALQLAKQLSEEATKEVPNKSAIISLWGKINAALPAISNVVKIAEGIASLFA